MQPARTSTPSTLQKLAEAALPTYLRRVHASMSPLDRLLTTMQEAALLVYTDDSSWVGLDQGHCYRFHHLDSASAYSPCSDAACEWVEFQLSPHLGNAERISGSVVDEAATWGCREEFRADMCPYGLPWERELASRVRVAPRLTSSLGFRIEGRLVTVHYRTIPCYGGTPVVKRLFSFTRPPCDEWEEPPTFYLGRNPTRHITNSEMVRDFLEVHRANNKRRAAPRYQEEPETEDEEEEEEKQRKSQPVRLRKNFTLTVRSTKKQKKAP
jgi:hypothetical protein